MQTCARCGSELPDEAFFCMKCGAKIRRIAAAAKPSGPVGRRKKGTGCVKNVGKKRVRPFAAYSGDGKLIGTFATRAEGINALDAFNANMVPAERINYTLADVYKLWSPNHFANLTDAGKQGYELAYKRCAELHKSKIVSLKTVNFQKIIDDEVARGLSRSSCEKQKQLFSQLCKYAMENDVISRNYAEYLVLPPPTPPKTRTLSDDEIERIFQYADDKRMGETARIALAMIYTGMRINELLTLEMENAHLDDGYVIGGEKTEAGKNRVIPIHEKVMPYFSAWMLDNATPYVIPSKYGLPRDHNNVRKSFNSLMKTLGIEGVTPHTCRHTAATRMVQAGVQPEIIKQVLGHSDYSTTVNKYTHIDVKSMIQGVSVLK